MKILLTGGNGRLGTELRALIPGIVAPASGELNITDLRSVLAAVERERPDVIVHAAAYTNVGGAEQDRERCWAVNVEGTRHMAQAADWVGAKLNIVMKSKHKLVCQRKGEVQKELRAVSSRRLPRDTSLGLSCRATPDFYFY